MSRLLLILTGLVGVGLVLAAGAVLVDGSQHYIDPAADVPASTARAAVNEREGVSTVVVRDPVLVVNADGSTAVGAYLRNTGDAEVSLMGIAVTADRHRLAVNETPWWLPVPAGKQTQVGAASDAGGFLIPTGLTHGSLASIEFRFDDGTCVLTDVTAASRSKLHRWVYPKTGRTIGPVTTDQGPEATASCGQGSNPGAAATSLTS